jgi:hypothetical protein
MLGLFICINRTPPLPLLQQMEQAQHSRIRVGWRASGFNPFEPIFTGHYGSCHSTIGQAMHLKV